MRLTVSSPDVFLNNIQSITLNCSGGLSVNILSFILEKHRLILIAKCNGDLEGQ
jgi:hypothetical protein